MAYCVLCALCSVLGTGDTLFDVIWHFILLRGERALPRFAEGTTKIVGISVVNRSWHQPRVSSAHDELG